MGAGICRAAVLRARSFVAAVAPLASVGIRQRDLWRVWRHGGGCWREFVGGEAGFEGAGRRGFGRGASVVLIGGFGGTPLWARVVVLLQCRCGSPMTVEDEDLRGSEKDRAGRWVRVFTAYFARLYHVTHRETSKVLVDLVSLLILST